MADGGKRTDHILAWLAEAYGLPTLPEVVELDESGTSVLLVDGRYLLVRQGARGTEIVDAGKAGRGRPRVVRRAPVVQRQYVDCVRQLHALRTLLAAGRSAHLPLGTQQSALRAAVLQIEQRGTRGRRLWLRALNFGVRLGGVFRLAGESADAAGIVVESPAGARVELRRPPPEHRLFAVFEGAAVERWSSLVGASFSPSLVALRMLTRFYRLRIDFCDPDFEDRELSIRKLVYPLAPVWRAALAEIEKKA